MNERAAARARELWLAGLREREWWSYVEALIWVAYRDHEVMARWLYDRTAGPASYSTANIHEAGKAIDEFASDDASAVEPLPAAALRHALDLGKVVAVGTYVGPHMYTARTTWRRRPIPAEEWATGRLILDSRVVHLISRDTAEERRRDRVPMAPRRSWSEFELKRTAIERLYPKMGLPDISDLLPQEQAAVVPVSIVADAPSPPAAVVSSIERPQLLRFITDPGRLAQAFAANPRPKDKTALARVLAPAFLSSGGESESADLIENITSTWRKQKWSFEALQQAAGSKSEPEPM